MRLCYSEGDYRHASIAPSRGASASVIQMCSLQPMSLAVMVVAVMVMLCGRYGLWPIWSNPYRTHERSHVDMFECLLVVIWNV